MMKIVSKNGDWNIIIDGIEYHFYYSNIRFIEGLCLDGMDEKLEEYKIGNKKITAKKEDYIYEKDGYRYILIIKSCTDET